MIADRIHYPSLGIDALMIDGRDLQIGDELVFVGATAPVTRIEPAPASTIAAFGDGVRFAYATGGLGMAVWNDSPVRIVATPAALARVTSPLQPARAA